MTLAETRTKILEDNDFVLEEVRKIQYLFQLKKTIRYELNRDDEEFDSESVAEHIYGMLVLTKYFLPLEDLSNTWDEKGVTEMILWHDIDEIETGDIIGYKKTDQDRIREQNALETVFNQSPHVLHESMKSHIDEYTARKTNEAKFVKAVDKMEPNFYLFNTRGKKLQILKKTTRDEHTRIKEPFIKDFPFMMRFNDVIVKEMEKNGHFSDIAPVS